MRISQTCPNFVSMRSGASSLSNSSSRIEVTKRLHRLRTEGGAVLIDFAGDRAIVRRVHEQLGETLERSILVGFTHSHAEPDQAPLPGPAPEFFFAPDEIARRGRDLGQRYAAAWERFAPIAERTVRIERVTDGDQLVRLYRALLEGRADPAAGYVVSLDPDLEAVRPRGS